MSAYARVTARTARKTHLCGGHPYCGLPKSGRIDPGDRYLEHVIAPGHHDVDNTGWWRLPECAACAERYGRGDLLAVA